MIGVTGIHGIVDITLRRLLVRSGGIKRFLNKYLLNHFSNSNRRQSRVLLRVASVVMIEIKLNLSQKPGAGWREIISRSATS